MGVVTKKKAVLKLVHPGGHVELHREPIPAAEVMNKYPRHCVTRPDVFEYPWIVVRPESILYPGSVFYIVPYHTMHRLMQSNTSQGKRTYQEQVRSLKLRDKDHHDLCSSSDKSNRDTTRVESSPEMTRLMCLGGALHHSNRQSKVLSHNKVIYRCKEQAVCESNDELSRGRYLEGYSMSEMARFRRLVGKKHTKIPSLRKKRTQKRNEHHLHERLDQKYPIESDNEGVKYRKDYHNCEHELKRLAMVLRTQSEPIMFPDSDGEPKKSCLKRNNASMRHNLRSVALHPVNSSSRTTPKAYTSAFSVINPVCMYSGASQPCSPHEDTLNLLQHLMRPSSYDASHDLTGLGSRKEQPYTYPSNHNFRLSDFLQKSGTSTDLRPGTKALALLQTHGGLKPTQRATVEEQVTKFLYILSLMAKNRTVSFFYHCSGETVSRHFRRVLRAVVAMAAYFLRQPRGEEVPKEILNNERFYPYFKVDGTFTTATYNNIIKELKKKLGMDFNMDAGTATGMGSGGAIERKPRAPTKSPMRGRAVGSS
ncbi:PADRE domain, partial [Dillenia turbinata]